MRAWVLGLALAVSAAPLSAQNIVANEADEAESRLRICLTTGAPGAPRDSLLAAVAALRSLCFNQITRVREQRFKQAEEDLRLPKAGLTANQMLERERAHDAATRKLNDEIVRAVSTFTGLLPPRPPQAETPRPLTDNRPILLQGSVR